MTFLPRMMVICVCLSVSPLLSAAVDLEAGTGGSCFSVVMDLQRDWLQLKHHLLPGGEKLDRPEEEQFVCVSRHAVRDAMERRSAMTSSIRCFRETRRNIGFCCDEGLRECAMLNPGLFPDAYKRPESDKPFEPPKSNWVRPPSESDQWKSN